jgi:hypothetical protein
VVVRAPHDDGTLQVLGRHGRGLRVVFVWQSDRFVHRIEFVDGRQSWCWFNSLEGDSEEPWPSSPPLQQLSLEEPSPGNPVALLLGMAGGSHWSVSVECDSASTGLIFDVACRAQQCPQQLGSWYHAAVPLAHGSSDLARFALKHATVEWRCQPLTDQSCVVLAQELGRVGVVDRDLATTRLPSTFRWRYHIHLLEKM